jgi:hypothetical protein
MRITTLFSAFLAFQVGLGYSLSLLPPKPERSTPILSKRMAFVFARVCPFEGWNFGPRQGIPFAEEAFRHFIESFLLSTAEGLSEALVDILRQLLSDFKSCFYSQVSRWPITSPIYLAGYSILKTNGLSNERHI